MSFDHGTLNIPLSKRGNINAQIDQFKADQAANAKLDRKARADVMAGQRMTAKGLVARVAEQRVLELAVRCNVTPATMRKQLKSDAHWQPALVIGLLAPKGA